MTHVIHLKWDRYIKISLAKFDKLTDLILHLNWLADSDGTMSLERLFQTLIVMLLNKLDSKLVFQLEVKASKFFLVVLLLFILKKSVNCRCSILKYITKSERSLLTSKLSKSRFSKRAPYDKLYIPFKRLNVYKYLWTCSNLSICINLKRDHILQAYSKIGLTV